MQFCENTPYDTHRLWERDRNFVENAQKEVEFLESLLPKKTKHLTP